MKAGGDAPAADTADESKENKMKKRLWQLFNICSTGWKVFL